MTAFGLFSQKVRDDMVNLLFDSSYGPLPEACTEELTKMTNQDRSMSKCRIVWPEWSEYKTRFPTDAAAFETALTERVGAASGKAKTD
jgi:hypothetical protein